MPVQCKREYREKNDQGRVLKKEFISVTIVFSVVAIAISLLVGFLHFHPLVVASASSLTSPRQQTQQQYWNKSFRAFSQPKTVLTDKRSFFVGDSIAMPNGLKLQVTQIQRHWQPTVAVTTSYGSQQIGDNPKGLETVLIWFRATNVGSTTIEYNDSSFTLQVLGNPEQRLAHLASLLPTDYGDFGSDPWLLPNESKETFVPFLVTPNAQLSSFQYYFVPPLQLDNNHHLIGPSPIIKRLSITLQNTTLHPSTNVSDQNLTALVFEPTESITIGQ